MITNDPYYKPVKAYRTVGDAFRDAEYAQPIEYSQEEYSPSPGFVLVLTLLCLAATILAYAVYS